MEGLLCLLFNFTDKNRQNINDQKMVVEGLPMVDERTPRIRDGGL